MEIDWDRIILDDELLNNYEFQRAVKNALLMEWPPPEGYIINMNDWVNNYQTWHAHLIPLDSFFIPINEAIEYNGLPYYTPVEDPTKISLDINILRELYGDWSDKQLELNIISKSNMIRDTKVREELISKAKNRRDVRWYMILHICYFNASIMAKIVRWIWPDQNWKIIESSGHVLVTDANKDQLLMYLRDGIYDKNKPFYIADALISGRQNISNLMLRDADRWTVYENLDDYESKCYREFFSEPLE
jgi:hypothetical protein